MGRGSEDRTSMEVLLHSMLRLPLSLPGDANVVLYPRFAFRSLDASDEKLRIDALMTRFLQGGTICHIDARAQGPTPRVVTPFAPLTLKSLGRELRESLVAMRK